MNITRKLLVHIWESGRANKDIISGEVCPQDCGYEAIKHNESLESFIEHSEFRNIFKIVPEEEKGFSDLMIESAEFIIDTDRASYFAEKRDDHYVVKCFFKSGVEATYTFKNHANTAVAQQIFNVDKHAIG